MTEEPANRLRTFSTKLRELHTAVLGAERAFHAPMGQLEMLDRLIRDPAWEWLRPLSTLIADIDHILASETGVAEHDLAVAATHIRELLTDTGDDRSRVFSERYLPLLQTSAELVSLHGELKALLKNAPAEPDDEAERLHRRHAWAMRCKHLPPTRP